MTHDMVDRIATAMLYEGYLLYPYRASAMKNRQRFNFGVLTPQDYSLAQSGTEVWTMQTECLVRGDRASIRARSRFLHLLDRQVEQFSEDIPLNGTSAPNRSRPIDFLEVDGRRFQTWQEAMEREVATPEFHLADLVEIHQRIFFEFGPEASTEVIVADNGKSVGRLVRTQQKISGALSLHASRLADDLYRLRVTVCNLTPLPGAKALLREQALLHSFASTHTVLGVRNGTFVSLLEPPDELAAAAAACQQVGCWPVLVGESGDQSTMLASPIILYDYPEIAAESPGDFFDGTEMDEMLMLRVMTMTDEEQREMRHVDEQARRLLERTENLPLRDLMNLHGKVRGMRSIGPSQDAIEENGATVKS